jgi:putative salt-induced outer membrane protein YdiY
MKLRCVWTAAVLAAWCAVAADVPTDVVVLANGSRLVGTVTGIAPGKIVLKTDFAGVLTLDSKLVVEMRAATQMHVAFADGRRVVGTLAAEAAGPVLRTESGPLPVADLQPVKAAWPEGQPDPTLAPPPARKWTHELALDVGGRTGNTRKTSLGGAVRSVLAGPDDKTALYARGVWAKENGTKTEDELLGGADYERVLTKRHTWYGRVEAEQDDIEALDLRTTAALGYGYYFIKQDPDMLRARVGLQYRHEDYQSGRTEDTVAAELGVRFERNLTSWAKLVSEITYAPAFDDLQDYRVDHCSSLDIPLGNTKHWTLRLGVLNSYNSTAADDRERLDTTYMARLVLKLP